MSYADNGDGNLYALDRYMKEQEDSEKQWENRDDAEIPEVNIIWEDVDRDIEITATLYYDSKGDNVSITDFESKEELPENIKNALIDTIQTKAYDMFNEPENWDIDDEGFLTLKRGNMEDIYVEIPDSVLKTYNIDDIESALEKKEALIKKDIPTP